MRIAVTVACEQHPRAGSARGVTLAALVAIAGLAGCEGSRCSEGVVSDAETAIPIEGVQCDATEEKGAFTGKTFTKDMYTGQVLTDAEGRYRVCGEFGGCVPTCPDIDVRFSKVGYRTITLTNPRDVALPRDASAPDSHREVPQSPTRLGRGVEGVEASPVFGSSGGPSRRGS